MTLETVGIFPLRFHLFIYFVFCLRFNFFLKPIVDAKGEGETLLLKKKSLFLVSQSVGIAFHFAAFNFCNMVDGLKCCCCLFDIQLHDRLTLFVQAKQDRVAELLVAASPAGR